MLDALWTQIILVSKRIYYIIVKYYYRFDIFNAAMDFNLEELNSKFSERTWELLSLSSTLNYKDGFKLFKI
jgi:hypothetical protein